jgi:hypothetical protein
MNMAKQTKVKEAEEEAVGTQAQPVTEPQVPATQPTGGGALTKLGAQMEKDMGKGKSQAADDNIVPLIYVLQGLSPQVNKRDPDNYIEGAEPGHFWLRNASDPIVNGEDGFVFMPCYFHKDIVEWRQRESGGGFVGRHTEMPADAEEYEHPQTKAKRWRRSGSGNELRETRYHTGFVMKDDGRMLPYVIPFSSTGHTTSKQWMVMMNQKEYDGRAAPSWLDTYKLTTKHRQNAHGEWYSVEVADYERVVQDDNDQAGFERYLRGLALFEAMTKGEKRAASEESEEATATGEDAPF